MEIIRSAPPAGGTLCAQLAFVEFPNERRWPVWPPDHRPFGAPPRFGRPRRTPLATAELVGLGHPGRRRRSGRAPGVAAVLFHEPVRPGAFSTGTGRLDEARLRPMAVTVAPPRAGTVARSVSSKKLLQFIPCPLALLQETIDPRNLPLVGRHHPAVAGLEEIQQRERGLRVLPPRLLEL